MARLRQIGQLHWQALGVRADADRVKALEAQISELEAEATRLLRALDSVKEAKADSERTQKKQLDETAKELATQVSCRTTESCSS